MTYSKPEVNKLDAAVKAIQGLGKVSHPNPDTTMIERTVPAYEADE